MAGKRTEDHTMAEMDGFLWVVTGASALVMLIALVRGVNQSGLALAQVLVDGRRDAEQKQRDSHALAEATGHAAGVEPLELNPDGSVVETIIGVVEK